MLKFGSLIGLFSTLVGFAFAQSGEHKYYAHVGDWTLVSNFNVVTGKEDFWIATRAINKEHGIFSVDCKVVERRFSFVIGAQELSYLPYATPVVVDARVAGGKQFKIAGAASGNGNIVIDEIANQSSFTLLLAEIFFPHNESSAIAFALGPNQWIFSLKGAKAIADDLAKHCGFTPDPKRARQR